MNGFLTSAIAFVFALGILVAVHEFGHYWVARRLGVRVLRFCIGFGKPIWSRVAGEDRVEYAVAAIPLGGYVKLLDEREGPVLEAERHRAFNTQTPARRIAILVAGPAFNFLFAIAAYWMMFIAGVTALKPIVGAVEPDSSAAVAGLMAGDEIFAVSGDRTPTLMDAQLGILDALVSAGRVPMTVQDEEGNLRDIELAVHGERRAYTEPGTLLPGLGITPWRPVIPPVIGDVTPDGTAAASGLQAGDLIVAAEGEVFDVWADWVAFVQARPASLVALEIERDGLRQQIDLEIGTARTDAGTIGRIGAGVRVPDDLYDGVTAEQQFGPIAALSKGVERTWRMSGLTVRMLYRMIVGDVSPKNISGPISIGQAAGYTASAGLAAFLSFLAIVSISLGILNLLPIPMLDGGQIAYQLVEIVKGGPVSERAQMIGQQIGIALLLVLMSFAFYNDIVRLSG